MEPDYGSRPRQTLRKKGNHLSPRLKILLALLAGIVISALCCVDVKINKNLLVPISLIGIFVGPGGLFGSLVVSFFTMNTRYQTANAMATAFFAGLWFTVLFFFFALKI